MQSISSDPTDLFFDPADLLSVFGHISFYTNICPVNIIKINFTKNINF